MARTQKTSPAQDLIFLVSKLPWWVGLALAVISYPVLHPFATFTPPVGTQPVQMQVILARSMWSGIAKFAQLAIPVVRLFGALASARGRIHRARLIDAVGDAGEASAINDLSWKDFEKLVGEAFRMQGFGVQETGGGGADGGVDPVLVRGNERFFVQCKRWRALMVSVDVVRELYGVMAARGATGGYVVTSGTFSKDATEFAEGRNITVIDGPELFRRIKPAKRSSVDSAPAARSDARAPAVRATSPSCPMCGSAMVKRTAKKRYECRIRLLGLLKIPELQRDSPDPGRLDGRIRVAASLNSEIPRRSLLNRSRRIDLTPEEVKRLKSAIAEAARAKNKNCSGIVLR